MIQFIEGGTNPIREWPKKLHSLKAHTFSASPSSSIYALMRESAKTIRSLSVGDTNVTSGGVVLKRLAEELSDPIGHAPLNVQNLEFIRLNIQCDSWKREFCNVFNTTSLRSLSLISCDNLDTFWDSIRASCSVGKTPVSPMCNLTSLNLRLEHVTDGTVTATEAFLKSIHGLAHLHILLDGIRRLPNIDVVIANHGSTLKTLVMDARDGPRTTPYAGTAVLINKDPKESSRFQGIVEGCPGLVELGISIDWRSLSEVR